MAEAGALDQFPVVGLRVLVVDDDFTCLKIVEQMLRRCMYQATTCSQATVALNLLRERKGCFDVVLSDVHMPDMDGFKLLELVGLEMDLPVIMMSADGSTNAVMRGIKHGACDYLIKPIREEELKTLWQHVVRKKWNENKEHEHSGSLDDNERNKRASDEAEYDGGGEGSSKPSKKRRDVKEDDEGEVENDDSGTAKKPRVVWSVELHQQFVSAVNQLGIDKAVPKRILELMNVPGLTRENVASHLQKFRLYLKRLVGHQGGLSSQFCGSAEQSAQLGTFGRFDMQALAASGQIPPQTLAALQAELLGRPTGSLVLPGMDQSLLQGSKGVPVDHGIAYGQPLLGCPSNISKQFPQTIVSADTVHSGHGPWPSSDLVTVGPKSLNENLVGFGPKGGNILMGMLQNQEQHPPPKQQQQKQSINVQPSCLVVPSQSSSSFQAVRSPASVNQNSSFSRSSSIDYSLLLPQSNTFCVGQLPVDDLKTSLRNAYSVSASLSPSLNADRQLDDSTLVSSAGGRQLQAVAPSFCEIRGSHVGQVLDQSPLRNLGFVGKGTSIPSRFAVDDLDYPVSNLNYEKVYGEGNGNKVKQEPGVSFIENGKVGAQVPRKFQSNDLMSVFSE